MHLRDQPTPLRKLDKNIPEDIADLKEEMEAMRRQLAELSQRK